MTTDKKIFITGLLLCLLIVFSTTISLALQINGKPPKKNGDLPPTAPDATTTLNTSEPNDTFTVPSTFTVYYRFGVGEKNIFDIQNHRYTKDMICEPSQEYYVELTEQEIDVLYHAILDNNIMNISDNFTRNWNDQGISFGVEPLSTARLTVTLNGQTKTIIWAANYYNPNDPEVIQLQNVTHLIEEILSQKETALGIEQPSCGYL